MARSPAASGRGCPSRRGSRALRALALATLVVVGCERAGGGAVRLADLPPPANPEDPASWKPYYEALASLGDGFVVWESRRDGHWRIWMRRLDGSPEHQLSPDEPGRDHVAAHVSPDGRHVVYLSLPAPHKDFERLPEGTLAPLHLLRLEGDAVVASRVLAPNAQTYQQSRAALWVNPRELIYIAGDRTTRQLDIVSGEERVLIPKPDTRFGMLVDASHTFATNGSPTFSIYHESDGSVARRKKLPGCQPYFTPDGRFGYWMADAGGPVRALDLASGNSSVVIDRDSKFLPEGHGYLYYPMMSPDQRLLAFSASRNDHGHFNADFDVFVAPLDPETLAVSGTAVRYSFSPAQDRFPDVFVAGHELGRLRGEAPFAVTFHPDPEAAGEPWHFEYGDGSPPGSDASHVFEEPGVYRVTARRGARRLGGEVRVLPGTPPQLLRAEVRPGGAELAAVFDERVDAKGARVRLESGAKVAEVANGELPSELRIVLEEPLAADDVLEIEGVADRGRVPHAMAPARVPVELSAWPGRGDGLAFVFETDGAPNLARDVDTGHPRTFSLLPRGAARYDANGALRPMGGWFEGEQLPGRLSAVLREAGAFTLEVTVVPDFENSDEEERILSLYTEADREELSLSQLDRHALLRLRTSAGGTGASAAFAQLDRGRPNHLLVSYRPGRLTAYQDGELVMDSGEVQGDLAVWGDGARIALGAGPAGARSFRGSLEGVALYGRFFEAKEAAAHANAYLLAVAARERVPRILTRALLKAASAQPTPEQIAPYREALVMNEYVLGEKKRKKLGIDRLRVAHWAILDGDTRRVPQRVGTRGVKLVLEPWDRYPRLDAVYLSDTLPIDSDVPLYVDVSR